MAKVTSGKRYAQAAFEIALERNELEIWQEGLKEIAALTRDEEMMAMLQTPRLPFDAKKSLLQKRLGKINPRAFNLALLLVSKGIFRRGNDIFQRYNALLDVHRGIERAKVTAALPLAGEDQELIARRLEKMVKHRVTVDTQVDPAIIGGLIARVGDMLIDGSIRQRLDTLKNNLVGAGR